MRIADEFLELTGKNFPAVDPDMEIEDKAFLAKSMVMAGESKVAVAKYLGVSRRTVYNYLRLAEQELLEELECSTQLSLFNSELYDLKYTRDTLRKKADSLLQASMNNFIDPNTGEKIPKSQANRDYAEMCRLIRDYDKLILDIQIKVGMIPSVDNLYQKISDFNPDKQKENSDSLSEKSSPELVETLLNKLQSKAPKLTASNALRENKNNPVI